MDRSGLSQSRPRRRAFAAASALLAAAGLMACAPSAIITTDGTQIAPGSNAVTLTNLHATKGRLSAVNIQGKTLIPVCSEVQLLALQRKRMTFRVIGTGKTYTYDYHGAAAEPFVNHLGRYFGPHCPRAAMAQMNALDRAGIEAGKPYVGMSKAGLKIAMGYPPPHKTPSLSAPSWRYWRSRFKSLVVNFDSSGHLTTIKGLKPGTYDAPAGLSAESQLAANEPAPKRASRPARTARRRAPAPPPLVPNTGAAEQLYSRRVAVVVGINDYQTWPSLSGASNDAQRMAEFLRRQGFDEVIEVYDQDATRRRVLRVLGTELPRIADENSLALIYFAGHGQTETLPGGGKRGYLIPADGDTVDVFSTAISMDTVRDLSKRTPAKHVYYAIDSCYSGLALTRGISRVGGDPNIYLQKITSMPAVQIITAGSEGEQAVEVGGQGLFTTYLLRALEGEADYNNDGAITASEIGAFVKPQVTNASRMKQTPQFGTMEGGGEIVFVLP